MYKSRRMDSQTTVDVDGIEFIVEFNSHLITLSNKELDLKFLYAHTNAFDVETTKIDNIGFSNYNGTVYYHYIYAFLTELVGENKQPKETKVFLANSRRYEYENSCEVRYPHKFTSDTEEANIKCAKLKVETEEKLINLRIKSYLTQRKTDAEIKELRATVDELRSQLAKLADK